MCVGVQQASLNNHLTERIRKNRLAEINLQEGGKKLQGGKERLLV